MKKKQWLMVVPVTLVAVMVLGGCVAKKNTATDPVNTPVVNDTETAEEMDTVQVQEMHTTKDTVDWAGTYKGVLPCASCEGIDTEITLNADGTYSEKTTYITTKPGGGEVDTETGTFVWDATGTTVILTEHDDGDVDSDNDDGKRAYLVTEGQMQALDAAGQVITGPLAENYILKKQ